MLTSAYPGVELPPASRDCLHFEDAYQIWTPSEMVLSVNYLRLFYQIWLGFKDEVSLG
jgi:hypothetical protein